MSVCRAGAEIRIEEWLRVRICDEGEKAREMPTQASVSESLIVQRDRFLRVCQGHSEWMPIITPNNVSQQYFNDVPFVEKPLSSQELIGF